MVDAAETPKPEYDGEALQKEGSKWMERIRAAEKRESDWRKDAKAAEKAYACNTSESEGALYDFNILHSNVETIVPAIYNSTPIPDVRRRWLEAIGDPPQDPTPQILQQAASQAGLTPEQAQQAAQTPQGQQMAQAVLQSSTAQRAIIAYQHALKQWQAKAQLDADTKALGDIIERAIVVQIDDNKLDKEIEKGAQDAFLSGRDVVRIRLEADTEGEQVSNERVTFAAVSWRNYRQGPATRWEDVPWVAFRHCVARETLESDYTDKDMLAAQTLPSESPGPEGDDDIAFWEVWSKDDRKVKFVREHDSKMLRVVDDPLGLRGFFPNPEPVQPITLTESLMPVCPFTIYKKLADELDLITKRINKIMKGLKVRGIAAGQAEKLVALAEADDNEIRIETDLEGLAQTGGLEKAIMWWPVEQAIKVLKELFAQREQVKASIYEITGISDIIRGASQAQETATAQQIKTQWGSLRIQKMQRLIERQVRDIFSMMAEIIASKFSPPTLYQMTAIEVTPGIQQLMHQPVLTSYRIDVESDSTVRADLTRQKQDMTEFLTGTANYFGTMGPLVAQAPEAAGPVADIYSSMARVFKLGRQAEDALEKLREIAKKAAATPRPNPEMEAMKAEQEAKAQDRQADMQMKQAEFQMKDAAEQRKEERAAQAEQRKIAVEGQLAQIQLQIANVNLQIKEAELALKERESALKLQAQAQSNAIKLDGQRESAAITADKAKQPASN